MAFSISIERLEANIEEVTIGRWLKAEGDPVAAGEPLVEIITDKITFEYEAEVGGILRRVAAVAKSTVPVGYIIGVIGDPDEPLPDIEAHNRRVMGEAAQAALSASEEPSQGRRRRAAEEGSRPRGRVRASLAARRRARELRVDLEAAAQQVEGIVSEADVERWAKGEG